MAKTLMTLFFVMLFFFGGGSLIIAMSLNERLRKKLRPKWTHSEPTKSIERIIGVIIGLAFWFAGINALRDIFRK